MWGFNLSLFDWTCYIRLWDSNKNDNLTHWGCHTVSDTGMMTYQSVLSTSSPNPGVSTTVSLSWTPLSFNSTCVEFIYNSITIHILYICIILLLWQEWNKEQTTATMFGTVIKLIGSIIHSSYSWFVSDIHYLWQADQSTAYYISQNWQQRNWDWGKFGSYF